MKNIILTICFAVVIQISTCGNQKSISSYDSRGQKHSVLEEMFQQYADEHDKIADLFEAQRELQRAKHKTYQDWMEYDHKAQLYFDEVQAHLTQFDSTTQQTFSKYFNKAEQWYTKSTNKFKQEDAASIEALSALDHQIQMMKLLSSFAQFQQYLKDELPNHDEMVQYNKDVNQLTKNVKRINTTFEGSQELVKNQD